ncbi:restriction endonuclease subunit S [Clostridium perfringens]|uniref:restriction endonuclease subunit S n=1 Tax=Clostridium perfringens TaxID=1502 RepID=UPI0030D1715F
MEFIKVKDICDIKTGKYDANHSKEDGKYKFFTCALLPMKADTYSFDGKLVMLPGNGANLGEVMYYEGKIEAYQRTYVLHNINIEAKFLYYFLKLNWKKYILRRQIGSATNYMKLEDILNFEVPNISLDMQKKIIDILDGAQRLIDKRKKQIEELDLLVKSKFIEMFGNPVSNPKGWEKVALIDLGELARGKSKHRPRNAPELMNGPYPLIQTGDVANAGIYIKEYTQTYSELGLQQSKMWKAGTLCITIAANIAKTTILTFDACFPDSIVAFIPNEKTNTMFIQFWMSFLQKILEDSAPESAQKNINLKILGEQRVIVPPIELQNQFAEFVKQVDKLKFEMEKSLKELENNFNSLMNKAFKGELF